MSISFLCSTSGKLPLLSLSQGGPALWLRGENGHFWDEDQRRWLDFDLCLGNVVWGHGRSEIVEAVVAELRNGSAPSIPSRVEANAAAILLDRLSRFRAVRFFKTGAEACTAAVRLSRGYTRRSKILSDGFHGWHDWGIGGAYPGEWTGLGVPTEVGALTATLTPADGLECALEAVQTLGDQLAVLVVRPEAWPARELCALIDAARMVGAITVCDEVTSHLKYSRTGSAAAAGATPDMICIGKGLANGMPLAALLGPSDLLSRMATARISSTNSSETASLAAMIAAETLLAQASSWPSWTHALDEVVSGVAQAIQELGLTSMKVVRHPGFFSIEHVGIPLRSDPLRIHLVSELGAQNIYTRGWFQGCDLHIQDDWAALAQALRDALSSWSRTLRR